MFRHGCARAYRPDSADIAWASTKESKRCLTEVGEPPVRSAIVSNLALPTALKYARTRAVGMSRFEMANTLGSHVTKTRSGIPAPICGEPAINVLLSIGIPNFWAEH